MLDATDLPRRAAAHLDLAWREMTRDRGAVQTPTFLRVITGEPHPLGNVAIVNDASGPDTTRAAVQALVDAGVPAAVVYTGDVHATEEQYLASVGFARGDPLPAMAVDARRRGLGAYATTQALRAAAALGYRVGVLQSSQAGYPVYRRLGFRDMRQLPMFVCSVT